MTFSVLLTLFGVLAEERLLVGGYFSRRDGWRATRVVQEDEGDLADSGILSRLQDEPDVAILVPAAGTLGRRRVCSEEMVHVSDRRVIRFPWIIGEGWWREAVVDGVDQMGVRHLDFSLGSDCWGDWAVATLRASSFVDQRQR